MSNLRSDTACTPCEDSAPAPVDTFLLRVWWARPDDLGPADFFATSLLDTCELDRLRQLRHRVDRQRYLVRHALARLILGEALNVPASELVFDRSCSRCDAQHGKPVVLGNPLHFSMSSAGDLVVLATCSRPVGVDVEIITRVEFPGFDGVALTTDESALVAALPAGRGAAARARYWTRKEALLKASGQGLAMDPREVVAESRSVADVDLAAGYACAVAIDAGKFSPGDQLSYQLINASRILRYRSGSGA
ncbi:4'-phosphopantetheinyl transferase superfamily protein [Nakamurella antarctica]|uniref:4'-phosphopantetheinyl transferase superfamily protein n=1 Tax=Nakamurella antarctica TaxID=1902245 RepID=A0A3G8ZND2_9ACTN|nr:4'-phosphopantetheinyl transferase superfamily protein [Nakamurella antarctica]AZI58317.1 4'-phosphopantetheinyl transferase superfamily protein [Nakamurella antarctica]